MPKQTHNSDRWYDVSIVVELLIHETPRGEKYAPEIGNLCVGFTSLTLDRLGEEIDDVRLCWPVIFPKTLSTKELLQLVEKKYMGYEEMLALKEVE